MLNLSKSSSNFLSIDKVEKEMQLVRVKRVETIRAKKSCIRFLSCGGKRAKDSRERKKINPREREREKEREYSATSQAKSKKGNGNFSLRKVSLRILCPRPTSVLIIAGLFGHKRSMLQGSEPRNKGKRIALGAG